MVRWHHSPVALAAGALAVGLVLTAAAAQAYLARPANVGPRVVVEQPAPQLAKPMTLLEAWSAAEAYGRNWHSDAGIAGIQSTDAADTKNPDDASAGLDGRRRSWAVTLVTRGDPRMELSVQIVDGVVVRAVEQAAPGDLSPLARAPAVDSTRAIASVVSGKPEFRPSTEKGQGVHFNVLAAGGGTVPSIVVGGQLGSNPGSVLVDGSNGRITDARQWVPSAKGGVLYSRDSGATWLASNLTGLVTSVDADPTRAGSAFAAVAEASTIAVYRTADAGATWSLTGRLPEAAGNVSFNILAVDGGQGVLTVLLGTRNGLWASRDRGATWATVPGLPTGPAQWLARTGSPGGPRVFLTISAGPPAGLYSSQDLQTWSKQSNAVVRLSHSFTQPAVFGVDEAQPGTGPLSGPAQASRVRLPARALRLAGSLDGAGALLAESPLEIQLSRDGGVTWTKVLERSLASIAVAPDFATSGVALAGGFRSGLFRTTDGGQHWQQVLANPSAVLAGNGEIHSVAFLSATQAIAVNGGNLEWH